MANVLSPPSMRRPGGRTARVRADVLSATLGVLADSGYAGLRIEEVARRAGVNKTTIYRRWRTVGALVADALLTVSVAEVPIPDTGSLRDDLLALARSGHRAITSPTGRALSGTLAASWDEPEIAEAASRFWRARYAANRAILVRASRRGEINSARGTRELVEAIAAPLYFRTFVSREPVGEAFIVRTVDRALADLVTRSKP